EESGGFARLDLPQTHFHVDAAGGDLAAARPAAGVVAGPICEEQDLDAAGLGGRLHDAAFLAAGARQELFAAGAGDGFGEGCVDDGTAAVRSKPLDPGDGATLVGGATDRDAVFQSGERGVEFGAVLIDPVDDVASAAFGPPDAESLVPGRPGRVADGMR